MKMKRGESTLSIIILLFCVVMGILFLVAGCSTLTPEQIEKGKEVIGDLLDKGEDGTDAPKPGPPREPVDPMSVPESGEFSPDPVQVSYHFFFADNHQVKFSQWHSKDHWGIGETIRPDGSVELLDANRLIRHGGLIKYKRDGLPLPVTTLDHGRRMFWMADAEERKDVKKVTIFEDGWDPDVERSLIKVQGNLGINSPLIRAEVKVVKRK